MIKKIEILGVQLDNYTVREAMRQVEVYLSNNVMNTIEAISMEMLVRAQADPILKESIEGLDLAIVDEKEILKVAGINTPQRIKETAEKEFFYEFMKRIVRNGKGVYLIGENKSQLDGLEEFLRTEYKDLKIVGSSSLTDCTGDKDGLVNEINIIAPDIVFSILPTPEQEYFLTENKGKLNVEIWYGLGIDYAKGTGISNFKRFFKRILHKGKLRSTLSKYNRHK